MFHMALLPGFGPKAAYLRLSTAVLLWLWLTLVFVKSGYYSQQKSQAPDHIYPIFSLVTQKLLPFQWKKVLALYLCLSGRLVVSNRIQTWTGLMNKFLGSSYRHTWDSWFQHCWVQVPPVCCLSGVYPCCLGSGFTPGQAVSQCCSL